MRLEPADGVGVLRRDDPRAVRERGDGDAVGICRVQIPVGASEPDPKRLLAAVARAVDEMRQGRNPIDEGGMVSLFASAEQRETLAKVQALMSLHVIFSTSHKRGQEAAATAAKH